MLPRNIHRGPKPSARSIEVSPLLAEIAVAEPAAALTRLGTSTQGLAEDEVERRLGRYGANVVASDQRHTRLRLFVHACLNPLVLLLAVLATVSLLTGDARAAVVMTVMIALGVGLRFFQEARANDAAARLRAMIRVTATVLRSGAAVEESLARLVPGDVVNLCAGDMIPADVRILACRDLFITQASLTGESLPVEKFETAGEVRDETALEFRNLCFLGTSVESGTATAVVVETGQRTYLGTIASTLTGAPVETSFDRGVTRFTWLMIGFIAVMVPLVFVINGLTKHDWQEAFFFAVAVAVGLTPEMLPMIVTRLPVAGRAVDVRQEGHREAPERHPESRRDGCPVHRQDRHVDAGPRDPGALLRRRWEDDDGVLVLAYLNSHFQTGLKNVLDRAVLEHQHVHAEAGIPVWRKIDEIPFDFTRRLMSVVVETPEGTHRLICKGAPEAIFSRCTQFELDGDVNPMEAILREDLSEAYDALARQGFRVLALAYRDFEARPAYSKEDECDLTLEGYVAFLDPPKETARAAVKALSGLGVAVKVLTGDNDLVSRKICQDVGIPTEHVLLGSHVEKMTDADLGAAAERATLFARMSPGHKQRVIRALQARGHVVGFLGDGINDSPALRVADVGISVDTAVDIAKESADMILLEKSLLVLQDGVVEGRKVFCQHPQVRADGRELQLREHVQRARRERLPALRADGADPDSHQQSALRLLAGSDSHRRRGPRADRRAPPVVHARAHPVHPVHRPLQLDLRLHDLLHDALRISLLGPEPRVALPDRLVRGVAADADPHHPRHPHEPHPLPPESRERAAHGHDGRHHAARAVAPVLAARPRPRLAAPAAPLLAPAGAHALRLRGPHADREDLAASSTVDLRQAGRRQPATGIAVPGSVQAETRSFRKMLRFL